MHANYAKYFFLLLAAVVSVSCGVPKRQYDAVVAENEQLKRELDDLKHGAEREIAQGRQLYESGKYQEALDVLSKLVTDHPDSNKLLEARQLSAQAQQRIAMLAKAEEDRVKAQAAREARELEAALTAMVKTLEEVTGITWYQDKTIKQLHASSVSLYIGKQADSEPWLRFKIYHKYSADNSWLFVSSYMFNIDGATFEITPDYDAIKRNNTSDFMYEWYDVTPDDQCKQIVNALVTSKRALLRLRGQTRVNDREITFTEKTGLKNAILAFGKLGGTW